METDPGLSRTQRWLQSFIIEPADTDEAALAAEAVKALHPGDVGEIVTPSATLNSTERAGVYRGMYLLRLKEALANDYPVIADYLGEDEFENLTTGYVRNYPSRSYTLNRLGDNLPAYITELPAFEQRGLLHDLARYELAVSQVFDAVESIPLTDEQIAAVPPESWESAVLKPIKALWMGRFEYQVGAYKEAYRDSTAYPAMEPAETRILIYRREYQVFWGELSKPAFALLEMLVGGEKLGSAVETACLDHDAQEDQLFDWFQGWMRDRLFAAVEIGPGA